MAVSYYIQRPPFSPGLVGSCVCPLSATATDIDYCVQPLCGCWGSNPSPHAHSASTSSTEPSLAPCPLPRYRFICHQISGCVLCASMMPVPKTEAASRGLELEDLLWSCGRRTCRENDLDIVGAAVVILAG